MKTHLVLFAALPVLFWSTALAQNPATPPPIRMGLWQYEVTMSGIPGPGGPRMIVTQSCVTPETWTRSFQNPHPSAQCTTTNLHQTAHSVTFDVACSQQNMTSRAHVQMALDSETEMHGTVQSTVSGPGFPGMNMTSAIHSKFLRTDCGEIQPGQSRMVSNP